MYKQKTLIASLNFTKNINLFFKSDWLITMLFQGKIRFCFAIVMNLVPTHSNCTSPMDYISHHALHSHKSSTQTLTHLLRPGGRLSQLLRPGGRLLRPGGRLLRPGVRLSRLLRPGGRLSHLLRSEWVFVCCFYVSAVHDGKCSPWVMCSLSEWEPDSWQLWYWFHDTHFF